MSGQPAKPTIDDVMGQALDAISANEMEPPEMSDFPGFQGAPTEGGALPGFGVVSDPGTGLRVFSCRRFSCTAARPNTSTSSRRSTQSWKGSAREPRKPVN